MPTPAAQIRPGERRFRAFLRPLLITLLGTVAMLGLAAVALESWLCEPSTCGFAILVGFLLGPLLLAPGLAATGYLAGRSTQGDATLASGVVAVALTIMGLSMYIANATGFIDSGFSAYVIFLVPPLSSMFGFGIFPILAWIAMAIGLGAGNWVEKRRRSSNLRQPGPSATTD